jgi:hypothetical protein
MGGDFADEVVEGGVGVGVAEPVAADEAVGAVDVFEVGGDVAQTASTSITVSRAMGQPLQDRLGIPGFGHEPDRLLLQPLDPLPSSRLFRFQPTQHRSHGPPWNRQERHDALSLLLQIGVHAHPAITFDTTTASQALPASSSKQSQAPESAALLFMTGRCSSFQAAIFVSSRSAALRAGTCTLQPRRCNSRSGPAGCTRAEPAVHNLGNPRQSPALVRRPQVAGRESNTDSSACS